jgi:hypothetical protein
MGGLCVLVGKVAHGVHFTTAEMPDDASVSLLCYLQPNKTGVLNGFLSYH